MCKVRKSFDKKVRKLFLTLVTREFAMATVFEAYYGGFEGVVRLEGGISWVQNENEVRTKVILKRQKFKSFDQSVHRFMKE